MSRLRIGLTGARGVLGRRIQADWPGVEWSLFTGDIRDYASVLAWFEDTQPLDCVIHYAAMVPTGKVDREPLTAFQTNVAGTCNLLEAIRSTSGPDVRPWVFIGSTSHVYLSTEGLLPENAPLRPVSLYGQTKLQAEEWGRIYAERFGLSICMGRIFSYTSPLQPSSYFVPGLIEKISKAAPHATLEIPGLHGTRDFLQTAQISQAVRFLFETRFTGTINIGTGTPVRLLDLARGIKSRLERSDVQISAMETGAAHLCADTSKLRSLGLNLQASTESLIEEMIPRSSN